MINFIFVALGGALGSCSRYAISLIPVKTHFPVLTLVTNILGALIIGFIAGIAENRGVCKNVNLFLKTGFCGGFTTFSTFSLEAYNLFCAKNYCAGTLYATLSLAFCALGIYAGKKFASMI